MNLAHTRETERKVLHPKYGIFTIKKNNFDIVAGAKDARTITYTKYKDLGFKSKSAAEKEFYQMVKEAGYDYFDLLKKYSGVMEQLFNDLSGDILANPKPDNQSNSDYVQDYMINKIMNIFRDRSDEELEELTIFNSFQEDKQKAIENTAEFRAEQAFTNYILQHTIFTEDGLPLWETEEAYMLDTRVDLITWLLEQKAMLDNNLDSPARVENFLAARGELS